MKKGGNKVTTKAKIITLFFLFLFNSWSGLSTAENIQTPYLLNPNTYDELDSICKQLLILTGDTLKYEEKSKKEGISNVILNTCSECKAVRAILDIELTHFNADQVILNSIAIVKEFINNSNSQIENYIDYYNDVIGIRSNEAGLVNYAQQAKDLTRKLNSVYEKILSEFYVHN